ncbi:MAG: c-type cytochrome [Paracoccaceae bacterium]
MKFKVLAVMAALSVATPVLATGDAAKGESEFKKCKSCHAIIADDGTEIVKGGKTGPNLYGVIGRPAASVEDFKYGDGILAAAEKGLVWDEENLAKYTEDPTAFLDEFTGDDSLKSKMTFKLKKNQEDIAAYLASVTQ